MRKAIIISCFLLASIPGFSQAKQLFKFPDYTFETIKANPVTPVKNQYRSGTCWAYSAISFFESEAIRLCGIKDSLQYPDFSEFFVVSHSYMERAVKYVRLDGNLTFGAGSEADDVLEVIRAHGIVPNEAMTGMQYGTELPQQAELDAVLKAFVEAVAKNPNKTLSTAWKRAFQGILDAYLGKRPETFTVKGQAYTPAAYRDAMKIKPDDYVSLTSFTHHPFYTSFALEVCDNWRWSQAWNIPIEELMAVLDKALNEGYTLAWGADVSHPGFTRNGLAILVDTEASAGAKSDQERWVGGEEETAASGGIVEKAPTQESRQEEFDNKTITDDHGMQIFGIARDQDGKKYYMVKNSWGDKSQYKGIWYATEAFVKGQTLDLMVHKNALPKELKTKLGIK